MKGLIITFIVIITLIGVGGGVSVFIYNGLANSVDVASQSGFDEGYAQGYEEGLKKGNEAGYQAGSKLGYIEAKGEDSGLLDEKGSYFLYNPTYGEVIEILASGEMDSAKQILDYAEANGIRVAYVRAPIAREAAPGRVYLYQLVAFETVDKGLIIIEPRSHREVKVEVGRSYNELNGFPASSYDDTITKMTIVW